MQYKTPIRQRRVVLKEVKKANLESSKSNTQSQTSINENSILTGEDKSQETGTVMEELVFNGYINFKKIDKVIAEKLWEVNTWTSDFEIKQTLNKAVVKTSIYKLKTSSSLRSSSLIKEKCTDDQEISK